MSNQEIMALTEKAVMNTYARLPLALVKGKGMRVWDGDGRQYLDFIAGIATVNLGHCHPAVVEAIKTQAETLLHVSNLYHIEPQSKLAALLVETTWADKVFFSNSGAEANEGAIKLARKYQAERGRTDKFKVVTAKMSFHGRTLATLTATGQDKVKKGFDPLPQGFAYVEYNDVAALEAAITEDTAAFLVETVQGEGGVHVATAEYLQKARELCDAQGALLIYDEVQTGAGRTGHFLSSEGVGVTPDVATMAKGLGSGVAIGAILARGEAATTLTPGTHASTFGGNPLATAAALATVKTMNDAGFMERVRDTGAYFMEKLNALGSEKVVEVRGRGLLIGVELKEGLAAIDVLNAMMEKGFLIGTAGPQVLRFAPPLVVERSEIDALVATLSELLG